MAAKMKFRAWDKEDEVMIDWFWLSSEGDLYETPVTVYDTPHLELERNDDLIAMQYTGLKDKNGVEIYEGDILRFISIHHADQGKELQRYEVKWDEYYTGFYPLNDDYLRGLIDWEVIGNIYQNPELLE